MLPPVPQARPASAVGWAWDPAADAARTAFAGRVGSEQARAAIAEEEDDAAQAAAVLRRPPVFPQPQAPVRAAPPSSESVAAAAKKVAAHKQAAQKVEFAMMLPKVPAGGAAPTLEDSIQAANDMDGLYGNKGANCEGPIKAIRTGCLVPTGLDKCRPVGRAVVEESDEDEEVEEVGEVEGLWRSASESLSSLMEYFGVDAQAGSCMHPAPDKPSGTLRPPPKKPSTVDTGPRRDKATAAVAMMMDGEEAGSPAAAAAEPEVAEPVASPPAEPAAAEAADYDFAAALRERQRAAELGEGAEDADVEPAERLSLSAQGAYAEEEAAAPSPAKNSLSGALRPKGWKGIP